MSEPVQTETVIDVGADDLPLRCPMPRTPVWLYHPRVYLELGDSGQARCPYCSTLYVFKGERPHGH